MLAHKQTGASLVELMIGMALGLASVGVVASVVGFGVGVNGTLLANSRLHDEVDAIGNLIAQDLKRAGFFEGTVDLVTDPVANPSPFRNSISVSAFPGEDPNSCILFSYDLDRDGVLDLEENFGYRVRGSNIEMRNDGNDCANEDWTLLSSSEVINVTELTFNTQVITENSVTSTEISLSLNGMLDYNNQLSRQYFNRFVVRNYD